MIREYFSVFKYLHNFHFVVANFVFVGSFEMDSSAMQQSASGASLVEHRLGHLAAPGGSPGSPEGCEDSPLQAPSDSSSLSPSPMTTVSLATTVSLTPAPNSCPLPSSWWHPHVYARPPKRPTPHFIDNILGRSAAAIAAAKVSSAPEDQPLNLTTKPREPAAAPKVPAPAKPFREPPSLNGAHRFDSKTSVLSKGREYFNLYISPVLGSFLVI